MGIDWCWGKREGLWLWLWFFIIILEDDDNALELAAHAMMMRMEERTHGGVREKKIKTREVAIVVVECWALLFFFCELLDESPVSRGRSSLAARWIKNSNLNEMKMIKNHIL